MKPSIGRIVHYYIPGVVLPAIIVFVHSDQVGGKKNGQWDWPPRVE